MKNKIAIGGIVFLLAFFAFSASAYTDEEIMKMTSEPVAADETGNSQENQSSGITQAPIKVRRVEATETDENKFSVEFDLENGASAQKGLKYSISLNEILVSDGQEYTGDMAYEKVYDDSVDLAPNEKIHKKTEFEVPDYLSGQFQLWVEVRTEKALTLGMMVSTSKVGLKGAEKYIDLRNCFLYIGGEQDKKYGLSQGVDISKNEKLYLSCEAENSFDEAISVIPKIETYYRSVFGKKEESNNLEAMAIGPKEKKTLVYEISKMSESQAYDAVFSLRNPSDEKDLSKKITAHYVVQGLSATIQNYGLDKSDYTRGDIANLEVFITPSADSFPNSRGGGTKSDSYLLEALIADGSNNECSQKTSQEIRPDRENEVWKVSLPISISCPGAKAVLFVKDKNGNLLDGENNDISTSDKFYKRSLAIARSAKIIIILILVIIAAYLIFLCFRRREKGKVIFHRVIISFILGSGLIAGYLWTNKVQAFSGQVEIYMIYSTTLHFYYSSDKDVYGGGETMTVVTWIVNDSWCNNGAEGATSMYGIINGQNKTFFDCSGTYCIWGLYNNRFDATSKRFSQTFTVPTAEGTYQAYFHGSSVGSYYSGTVNGEAWTSYQVVNPPRTSCATISPSPARQRDGEDSKIFLSFTASDPKNSAWVEYYITYKDMRFYSNGSACNYERGWEGNVYYNYCSGAYFTVRSGQISGTNYPYTFQWPDLTSGTKSYSVKVCRSDGTCSASRDCSFDLTLVKNNSPVSSCPTMNPVDPLSLGQTTQLTMTATDADNDPLTYYLRYCSGAGEYNATNPTLDNYCGDWDNLFYNQEYNSGPLTNYAQNYRNVASTKAYNYMEGIMHLRLTVKDDHGGSWTKLCEMQVGSQKVTMRYCPVTDTSHSWRYAPEVGTEIPMSRPGNYSMWTVADIRGAADDPDYDSANRYGMKFYFDWNRDGTFEQTYDARPGIERFYWEYSTSGYRHDVPQGVSFYNIKVCDRNSTCSATKLCYVAAYNDLPYATSGCPSVSPAELLVNQAGTFTFNRIAFDPNYDAYKYIVNWGDGTTSQSSVRSNNNYSVNHSWNSVGAKNYTWYAEDSYGGRSPVYTCSVTVAQPNPVSCGSAISQTDYCSVPNSNLCVDNTNTPTVDTSDSSVFKWTCSNAGGSVDCSVNKHCSTDNIWEEIWQ